MASGGIRRFLEVALRNLVLRRKLPAEFGRLSIFVTPDSALQFLKPGLSSQSMSAPLLSLAKRQIHPGDHIWDIGANVGVLSFAAVHQVGPKGSVLAVEADYFLGWLLQKSVNANAGKVSNLRVLCAAVSEQVGFATLQIANRGRASNGLNIDVERSQTGGVRYQQEVVTVTLDSLLTQFHRPTLVKIDVEGAEALVLRGANKLLSEVRPTIYIEVGGGQVDEVTNVFRSRQYQLFDGESTPFAKIEQCVFNTLAIPQEKVEAFLATNKS